MSYKNVRMSKGDTTENTFLLNCVGICQIIRILNLFVASKNEFFNPPIHESKVLKKKQGLKCFLK